MLAGEADYVIGTDTHRDTHTAVVVETATGVIAEAKTTLADSLGHKRMLAFACRYAPGRRVWAIESTGSYGAGLTAYLLERGERVVEVDRPEHPRPALGGQVRPPRRGPRRQGGARAKARHPAPSPR